MYLLKTLGFAELGKYVKVKNGIELIKMDNKKYEVLDPFWGKASVIMLHRSDESKFERTDEEKHYLLTYISSIFGDSDNTGINIGDGFRDFKFFVAEYTPEYIDGYIIFIHLMDRIETDGQKIFGRYPNEIVVILKEGNYLEFSDRRVEVINSKLMLVI